MNHPHRNWRARMQASAELWLDSPRGELMSELPMTADPMRWIDGMRNRLREAYNAGYQDRHARDQQQETK